MSSLFAGEVSSHSSTVPRWICKQLDTLAMSDANLYFIVIRFRTGPTYDRQPIPPNAYGMFLTFLDKYFTYSQLLRFSFSVMPYSKFLPTFS